MSKHRRFRQSGCRFIRYLAEQRPTERKRSRAFDSEIAIDRQRLHDILDSLEAFSGE
ncbi:MAG TPA: hypothetical protein V6D07_14845 [Trichocoleus sp.]